MKTRLRWFNVALTLARLRHLAEGLRAEAYTPDRSHGFVLAQVRPRMLTGKHVEKRIVETNIVDPLGGKLTQTITEFREVRFVVSADAPGLELIDAPRAPRLFLTRFGHHLQFKVPIEPVEVDPLAWLGAIEDGDLHVDVRQIEYTHVAVEKGVVGVVRVASDASDVRAAAAKLMGNRAHRVRRVTAAVRGAATSGASIECTLDRGGGSVLPGEVAPDLVGEVRHALVETQRKAAPRT